MNAAPIQISESMSFMGLIVFGIVGLGCLFVLMMILRTFTGRTHRGHQSVEAGSPVSRPRSVLGPVLLGISLLVAGVVLVGVLTLVPYQMKESSGPVSAQYEPNDVEPMLVVDKDETHELTSMGETEDHTQQLQDLDLGGPFGKFNPDAAISEESDISKTRKSLPAWTKREQTILASGEVPTVLFVETSGLYSTQEEAMAEATKQAISKFRSRLAETYRKLAVQPVPENVFQEASVQKVHIEKRMHSFGTYEEPMYRVYLEYIDSAAAREPVIEAWKSTFSSNRALQFGIGFGALAALLGVVSAGLRALSAAKGSRGRAVMTALAFAGLGLVGLLFVA